MAWILPWQILRLNSFYLPWLLIWKEWTRGDLFPLASRRIAGNAQLYINCLVVLKILRFKRLGTWKIRWQCTYLAIACWKKEISSGLIAALTKLRWVDINDSSHRFFQVAYLYWMFDVKCIHTHRPTVDTPCTQPCIWPSISWDMRIMHQKKIFIISALCKQ